MSDRRVGIAFGGGVVRGMAHIGVLSVLEEAGIKADFVAGTSVGAVIGAAYCAGIPSQQIREWAAKFSWWRIARPVWPRRGLLSFDKLAHWIEQELGDPEFSDLKIPLSVVATDIVKGIPVTLSVGKVSLAVQGSCSVPGLVAPVEYNGRLLCDGGAADMLPVDILRKMGADYVIGVDLFTYQVRTYLGPLGYLIAGIEILLERSGGGIDNADCLISPQLEGMTYLRFSKREQMYMLGRQAAIDKLNCIRKDLGITAPGVQLHPHNTQEAD